jgi:hypothetical protein
MFFFNSVRAVQYATSQDGDNCLARFSTPYVLSTAMVVAGATHQRHDRLMWLVHPSLPAARWMPMALASISYFSLEIFFKKKTTVLCKRASSILHFLFRI